MLSLQYKVFLLPLLTYASPGWFPFLSITNFTKLERLHRAASRAITSCLLSYSIPLLLSEASLPILQVTLTHFTLSSYERALRFPTSFPISGLARLGVKPKLCRLSWRAFAATHPIMLPSVTFLSYSLNSFLAQPSTRLKQKKTYIILKVSETTPCLLVSIYQLNCSLSFFSKACNARLISIIRAPHREPARRRTTLLRQPVFKTNVYNTPTSLREALVAFPHSPSWNLPLFTVESTLSSSCSSFDPPFPRQGAALAHLDSLPPLMIWYSGLTALFVFLLAKAALAFLPTALFVALRPLFPFQQAQFVQVFPLKPTPFCTLFAGLGSINKSSISLLFSYYLTFVLSSLPSFLLCQTLWQIWQELSSLSPSVL